MRAGCVDLINKQKNVYQTQERKKEISATPPLPVPSQVHWNWFVRTKRNQFFFSGGSHNRDSTSRSPREGVDTCRDRALNASERGFYGQAKAGKAAKATHGTQVPS